MDSSGISDSNCFASSMVLSLDLASMMMTSKSLNVCLERSWSRWPMTPCSLRVGMMMVKNGDDGCMQLL